MRIVFTGGGTGGHILPNIAVIEELVREMAAQSSSQSPVSAISRTSPLGSLEILYIGTKNLSEQQLVEREMRRIVDSVPKNFTGEISWQYRGISSGKLRRYFALKNFTDMGRIAAGFIESLLLLRSFKPDVVFCKGGYVTVPVAAAARVLGKPVWIHESDVSPGLATKINSRFAERIFVSFEETKKYFVGAKKEKVHVVGNPIRASVTHGNAQRARDFTCLHEKKPTILVMGGSLGSQFINSALEKCLDVLLKEYAVIHITGHGGAPLTDHRNYRAYEFIHEQLPDCYALADVIVSRSGAGSVFECAAVNKPTLFIPLSRNASRGDQIENAHAALSTMTADILEEEILRDDSGALPKAICALLNTTKKSSQKLQIDAAQTIMRNLLLM